jgi:cephalosporin-C deacetylase
MTDAVRAVEAARANPRVDAARVMVAGGSQGGALTLAVAGLVEDLALAMPEVPFLCHFERAIEITGDNPYGEIVGYLRQHRDRREQILTTLSYFDGVNFTKRSKVPAYYSVGLMDTICPPSTVYAAYNALTAPKDIEVYYYNNHEGGGPDHKVKLLQYARRHLEA